MLSIHVLRRFFSCLKKAEDKKNTLVFNCLGMVKYFDCADYKNKKIKYKILIKMWFLFFPFNKPK